ncbi:MAG: hypothetical protein Dbin4_02548 [Alphaproteobacteria bacterium]|nr:hypothetical protein [Alphaproteobacteria bacterium]
MTPNQIREKAVTRALWAIQAYVLSSRKPPPIIVEESRLAHAQKLPDHVSDLLTDLMHYCDGGEYSFADCLRTAQINFEAEKNES